MSLAAMSVAGPSSGSEEAAVAAKVAQAKTSFYWAMRLLPPPRRAAMFAIYAFCREVDDIADEGGTPAEKRAGLAEWRHEIAELYAGRPRHAVARALLRPVREYELRREDFLAVIDGMEMDAAEDIRAPSFAVLDLYCARVASAVGLLSVRAFGDYVPAADEVAAHLGRALQLTNILRDVAEDASRGRLYLPAEALRGAGIDPAAPVSEIVGAPGLAAACREVASVARGHFEAAHAAMHRCPRRAMRPAAIMGGVYWALLRRLEEADWRDPQVRVSVPASVKLWIAVREAMLR